LELEHHDLPIYYNGIPSSILCECLTLQKIYVQCTHKKDKNNMIKSQNVKLAGTDEDNIKNMFNAFVQYSQSNGWKSVKDELPPKGDYISVVAMDDNVASYGMRGSVMNSTWFCKKYKKEGWTHWMLLPMRPSQMKSYLEYMFNKTPIQHD